MRAVGRFLAVAVLLSTASVMAKSRPQPDAWPGGIYSSVRMSEQTGDLGGMETRFYAEAGKHMVEFVWCEGWCNESFKVPVERTKDGQYTFTYFQRYADGGADAGVTMRFLAWFEGDKLRISAWQGDQKLDYEGKPQSLKRIEEPFGLTIANVGEEDGAE